MQTYGLCSWQTLGRRPRIFYDFLCMLESFRIVFTAYSLFLAVPTARFSLSFPLSLPLILHIMQKLRTNIRRIHATIMVGGGGGFRGVITFCRL